MSQENIWVKKLVPKIENRLRKIDKKLEVFSHKKLPYAGEIANYIDFEPLDTTYEFFETDISVFENDEGKLIPRVVIECKLGTINTHDAITYSVKASSHKAIHPYLRYGTLLGDREHYAIPGRLFRHGPHFDFMVSWVREEPGSKEWNKFINLLWEEIESSRAIQTLLLTNRSSKRKRFSIVHRSLKFI